MLQVSTVSYIILVDRFIISKLILIIKIIKRSNFRFQGKKSRVVLHSLDSTKQRCNVPGRQVGKQARLFCGRYRLASRTVTTHAHAPGCFFFRKPRVVSSSLKNRFRYIIKAPPWGRLAARTRYRRVGSWL